MVGSLKDNPVIEKSLRRLRNMGFKVYVEELNSNIILIVIDRDSIVKVLTRLIDRQITYPKHFIAYDHQNGVVVGYFWKGELPNDLKMKMYELAGGGAK